MADKRKIDPDIDLTYAVEDEKNKISKAIDRATDLVNDAIKDTFTKFGTKIEEGMEDHISFLEKGMQKGIIGEEVVESVVKAVYKAIFNGLKKAPKGLAQTLFNEKQLTQLIYDVLHSNTKGFGHIEGMSRNISNRANKIRITSSATKDLSEAVKSVNNYNFIRDMVQGTSSNLRGFQSSQIALAVENAKRANNFYAPTIYKSYAPTIKRSGLPIPLSSSTGWQYGPQGGPIGTGLVPQGPTGWSSHFNPTNNLIPYTEPKTTNYRQSLVDSPGARKLVLWGIRNLMKSLKTLPMFKVIKKGATDILRLLALKYASDKDNPKFLRKLALGSVAFQVPESIMHLLGSAIGGVTQSVILFHTLKSAFAAGGINIGKSYSQSGFGKTKGFKTSFAQQFKDFFGPERYEYTGMNSKGVLEYIKVGGGFAKIANVAKSISLGILKGLPYILVDFITSYFNKDVEQFIKQYGAGGTFGKKLQMGIWHGGKGAIKGAGWGSLIGGGLGLIGGIIATLLTGVGALSIPGLMASGASIGAGVGAGAGGLYGLWKGLSVDVSDIKDNTEITKNQLRNSWWDGLFGGGGSPNPSENNTPYSGDVIPSNVLDFSQPIKKGMDLGNGYTLTSLYSGWRQLFNRPHRGIDIAPTNGMGGAWAKSLMPGKITYIGYDKGGYGGYVDITDSTTGYKQRIGHIVTSGLSVGQEIKEGENVAQMASKGSKYAGNATGITSHYEIKNAEGKYENPAEFIHNKQSKANNLTMDTVPKNDDKSLNAYTGMFTEGILTGGSSYAYTC